MNILFIDEVCPKPYDPRTLETEAMGGSEATLVRVAEALVTQERAVFVEQHNRTEVGGLKAHYRGAGLLGELKVSHVICQRSVKSLVKARKRFPRAKLYLWLHDLAGDALRNSMDEIISTKTTVICVSEFHKFQVMEVFKSIGYQGQFQIKRIYNPIDDGLAPDDTAVDHKKLVWFSSPHKGLDRALAVFERLRDFIPEVKLYVANPGYFEYAEAKDKGVVWLNSLPHKEVIKHVREALCVFYPNTVFPETFGLVMAEANAVGTPVITHRLGASPEVVDVPHQELVNCYDNKALIDRVVAWSKGDRPTVRANKSFRLANVIKEWERVLRAE